MENMTRQAQEFGEDHRLIHYAVVTGRKVGAGKSFWSRLAHDEDFFRKVVKLSEDKLDSFGSIPSGLFIPAYQQLNCVKSRNIVRNWGLTEKHFEQLGEPPAWPSGLLSAVVLDVGLDTVQQTFEEAWACIVESQQGYGKDPWHWDGVKSDKDHLRLHGNKTHERGLRWRVIDFAAHWDKKNGIRPKDVRDINSPDSACLWAASYFPKYVQAMDGENIPFMWIPGYELNVAGGTPWTHVPHLYWYRVHRQVKLDAGPAYPRGQYWAVPSPRE